MKVLGKELSTPVGGVPYREGIFSTWNDPAKFGLFYHAALITRRCDITPANKKVAVYSTDLADYYGSKGKYQWAANGNAAEQHRVATTFDPAIPEGYDEAVPADQKYPNPNGKRYISDNGQLWRDTGKRIGVVDTERTKVVYGFAGLAGNQASTQNSVHLSIVERYPVFN